jgi:peroxiredoxin
LANYVEHLQPELIVNYCKLVVVSVDDPMLSHEVRDGLGATFPFLSDHEKKVITELDIVDATDPYHSPVAIPYTFVLDRDRTIYKIYNGWWYVGRPTAEELRMDLRALMSRRQDWWYDKTPPPYAEPPTA